MTRQEENEMILKIRNKELDFSVAVEQYDKFLWKKIHSYSIVGQEVDDMYSHALMCLHTSIEKYDDSYGVGFTTYLGTVLDRKFLALIQRAQGQRGGDVNYFKCDRLNRIALRDESRGHEFGELIPDNDSVKEIETNVAMSIVRKALDALDEGAKELLELHLFTELPQRDIAEKIGKSQAVVSRRIKKYLVLLQQEMVKQGITSPYLGR